MMSRVSKILGFFWREGGPTAVEYAVALGLIGAVAAASARAIGPNLTPHFTNAANSVGGAS